MEEEKKVRLVSQIIMARIMELKQDRERFIAEQQAYYYRALGAYDGAIAELERLLQLKKPEKGDDKDV